MESIIILFILFGLLLLRIPIYICLYLTGVLGLWIFTGMDLTFVAQTMLQKLDNFSLLSIPFFILMGAVMVRGQSATRLVQFAWKFVSWLPGGLGITAVVSSGVFGAISGSAISTVVTIGGVMFPHMDKYRYPKDFSVGLVTAAAILGIIIPPSIIMIVCALTAGESVVRLFAAGYLPGILIMIMLSLYAWWEARRKGVGRETLEHFDFKGLLTAGKNAFFAIFIIAVLFAGIYSGAFTITEASVVSCVLILVVEMIIYRAVSLKDLKELLISSGVISGALVITVSGAGVISEYIILRQIPQKMLEISMTYIPNASVYLAFTCVVLLIIGTLDRRDYDSGAYHDAHRQSSGHRPHSLLPSFLGGAWYRVYHAAAGTAALHRAGNYSAGFCQRHQSYLRTFDYLHCRAVYYRVCAMAFHRDSQSASGSGLSSHSNSECSIRSAEMSRKASTDAKISF
ncbi:MAG: hypothetical protein BWK80_28205 [Desulfobacteraceae bacterium IS3]|nr:MAG: hypothetical protein BWK80_28205 [Desulfobacteraceae bacterium IS3]